MRARTDLFTALAALSDQWAMDGQVPGFQIAECVAIGRELYNLGGEALMQEAYYHAKGSNRCASVIQAYWDGIGDWQW